MYASRTSLRCCPASAYSEAPNLSSSSPAVWFLLEELLNMSVCCLPVTDVAACYCLPATASLPVRYCLVLLYIRKHMTHYPQWYRYTLENTRITPTSTTSILLYSVHHPLPTHLPTAHLRSVALLEPLPLTYPTTSSTLHLQPHAPLPYGEPPRLALHQG